MITSTQKWVQDTSTRSQGWIEGDGSRASPAAMDELRRRLTIVTERHVEPPDDPHPQERLVTDGLWLAALHADEQGPRPGDVSVLWEDLVAGRATILGDRLGATRSYVVALMNGVGGALRRPLPEPEARVLLGVLCGEQQKAIAADARIACSTASKRCGQALEKLDLHDRDIPLPVVAAAHAAARVVQLTTARRSTLEHHGRSFVVVSIPRPRIAPGSNLTASEQDILVRLVEGRSRREIAAGRATSPRTVSCQLRAVFAKLRFTGRYGVIRRAAELGWF